MESTKHKLPKDMQIFLTNLKGYIELPLYFYGSIQRDDYFSGSDIDVDIFTDNVDSTIEKLSHYLDIDKHKFDKTLTQYNKNDIVYGHKIMHKSKNLSLPIEFCIYNNKYKQTVLHENSSKIVLPIYVSISLIILKYFFYTLKVINNKTYIYIKKHLLSTCIGKPVDVFIKW